MAKQGTVTGKGQSGKGAPTIFIDGSKFYGNKNMNFSDLNVGDKIEYEERQFGVNSFNGTELWGIQNYGKLPGNAPVAPLGPQAPVVAEISGMATVRPPNVGTSTAVATGGGKFVAPIHERQLALISNVLHACIEFGLIKTPGEFETWYGTVCASLAGQNYFDDRIP